MYQCSSIYTFFVVAFHLSILNFSPALVVLKFFLLFLPAKLTLGYLQISPSYSSSLSGRSLKLSNTEVSVEVFSTLLTFHLVKVRVLFYFCPFLSLLFLQMVFGKLMIYECVWRIPVEWRCPIFLCFFGA